MLRVFQYGGRNGEVGMVRTQLTLRVRGLPIYDGESEITKVNKTPFVLETLSGRIVGETL